MTYDMHAEHHPAAPAVGTYPPQTYPGQQYAAPQYPGQQYPGQQYQTPQHPGQEYPGQQYQTPQYPGQEYQGQQYPGQEYPAAQLPAQQYPGAQYAAQPQQAYPGQPYAVPAYGMAAPPQAIVLQAPSHPGRGMSITSLVIGIIAAVFFWIPGLNLILAVIATVFGGVGLGMAVKRNGPKGMAIAGLVLGVLVLAWSLLWWAALAAALSNA